jgi:leucyl-tRNA synthetase
VKSLPAVADLEVDFSQGVDLGSFAVHPFTGQHLPIWAAPYVLSGYGTGTIMAVPAHDDRDWQFAKAHNLPIVEVVSGGDVQNEPLTADGIAVNSGEINGLAVERARFPPRRAAPSAQAPVSPELF